MYRLSTELPQASFPTRQAAEAAQVVAPVAAVPAGVGTTPAKVATAPSAVMLYNQQQVCQQQQWTMAEMDAALPSVPKELSVTIKEEKVPVTATGSPAGSSTASDLPDYIKVDLEDLTKTYDR
jgi:hypothetical protein